MRHREVRAAARDELAWLVEPEYRRGNGDAHEPPASRDGRGVDGDCMNPISLTLAGRPATTPGEIHGVLFVNVNRTPTDWLSRRASKMSKNWNRTNR